MVAATRPCEHLRFSTQASVFRLTDADGGPVTGYALDLTVKCDGCGLPFRFLGLPFGSHPLEPRLSADSETLRAPIEPAYSKEVLGHPMQSGRA